MQRPQLACMQNCSESLLNRKWYQQSKKKIYTYIIHFLAPNIEKSLVGLVDLSGDRLLLLLFIGSVSLLAELDEGPEASICANASSNPKGSSSNRETG
mmetsp:Transcript_24402/g.40097  ORF Transcript_24402/g.40097 Transcript_24402/m.40097 type:complete len:98 (+) Transcript_24402:778-1071(+)